MRQLSNKGSIGEIMIDRLLLLKCIENLDKRISLNLKNDNENGTEIHNAYMGEFRRIVNEMPDEKPKDRLSLGFEIGIWSELAIILILLKLSGTI